MFSWAKSIFTYTLEIVLAAFIALIFFLVLFFLMNRFFPIGPGLDVLISGQEDKGGSAFSLTRSLWVSSGGSDSGLNNRAGDHVATLDRIRNDVRSKKANAIAWQTAFKDQELYDRDSIQTFKRSSAVIKFDADNEIELGADSLIIIKRLESDLIWPEKRTFMVMVDGELRGKIKATGSSPLFVEIETPNAVANVQSLHGGEGVDFKITVDSEASSSITVYEGLATIMGAGQSVEINANQTTLVTGDNVPAIPEALPEKVRLTAPKDNKQYIYRELPPKVKFSWATDEHADIYRFTLAKDAEFRDIVHEQDTKGTRFVHGNLKQGHYFWRVVGINKNGGEGLPSEVMRIQLKQDLTPPQLTYVVPEAAHSQNNFVLEGRAELGAEVFIGGEKVEVDESGKFSYDMELKPGVNIIVIEAVDAAGNVTYQSETVHGKF